MNLSICPHTKPSYGLIRFC